MNFQDFKLHDSLLKAIADLGFTSPTPIQEQAIPFVLEGRDLLGSAQTGTGKTAAFMLPVLNRLIESDEGPGLKVLVLEPTRELALQVEEQAKLFGRHTRLRSACVYGGVAMGPQEKALKDGYEIIAATPGRLLDHMRQGNVDAKGLKVLVLDEVDRMLDMGFLPDVRSILSRLPQQRQTLFFSATVPGEIGRLADHMLKDPARVAIAPDRKTAEGIDQKIYPCSEHLKPLLLNRLLTDEQVTSALVFTRTRQGADKVCSVVERHGFSVERIHGDRSQKERQQALTSFKEGKVKFLVATDIAARGLDVEGISHVINYDMPDSPDDYVHRIGRTARAGATGHAWSLMSTRESLLLSSIEQHIQMKLETRMLDNFDYNEELGPQHEVRQGHNVRHFDERGPRPPRPERGARGASGGGRGGRGGGDRGPRGGSGGRPRPDSVIASPGGVLRDSDERATIIVRPKGAVDLPEASQPREFSRPQAEGEGGERDPRRRRRGGRGGRDRERPAGADQGGAQAPRQPYVEKRDNSLSATDVLRKAGQQKAAVESSAMELRPREAAPGASAPAHSRPPREERPPQPRDDRPIRQDQGRSDLGQTRQPQGQQGFDRGGDRGRRRRRGGRGGGQDNGGGRFERGQGGQGGQRFDRDRSGPSSQPSQPVASLWSKIKGVFGLGSRRPDSEDKW